ncbi:radical SAM domain protein [Thermoclostridium stercorarium subsp. stercorarium DSM 8532]|jgi:histone acetyltransferase (RNA polymerase elongator complex component)|uniref:Radical SAM domain protein n=2 Tax=Thermoclostridium stercorarium TaxID=1510 RepID=L7VJC4_THES1|nr:radical SAM protein [Thermoclostridium stercorarium]AGC68155.1 radical SAM domain protein [Thermoclostridium stercorarium subsp. stercorarium DSM 8532]AGI39181.1 histone acetyltransferase [Thermoclostridium stercorarium subsp. stercorarium DSM 8532]ANX01063.1 radical SAM protein [Thermoclostridium stercorarium subsp. leptospartum DSM 9219]UZQ86680.1 radical SAM protein [Thermoclostridium stercorarium]
MSRHINIPIFIPHEGCPNDCAFCNQRKISGHVRAPSEGEVRKTIDEHLKTTQEGDRCEIAFFGGSFTGLPRHRQELYLGIARQYVKEGRAEGIRLSTRPDYINEEILAFLREYPVKVIELGIQSLDEEVLQKSNRNYSPEVALSACRLVKDYGFCLGVQTMLGLPGDTLEKSINTAKRLIELKPDMARIYPTLVIRDTALEQEYIGGKYIPLSLDEAVRWCSILVPMYENAGIKVIRVGLHAEELIRENEIVAGPVHPAFGALVYSKIWLDRITETIEKTSMHNKRKLIIHVAPSDVSLVTGQNRRNVDFLKENYRFSVVKVIGDQNSRNSFELEFRD